MERPKQAPAFETLRSSLTPGDRALIDSCWLHYKANGTQIPKRDVYHAFERPQAEEALKRLPRTVLRTGWGNSGDTFQVTFLGALLSSEGERLERLVAAYLAALRKAYDADHKTRYLSQAEFNRFVVLSSDELDELGRLLSLGIQLVGTSVSGPNPDGTWAVSLGDEFEDIRRLTDVQSYIREQAIEQAQKAAHFSPAYPYGSSAEAAFLGSDASRMLDGVFPSSSTVARNRADERIDFRFMNDAALRAICERDWEDALGARQHGLMKACIILCGAVAEALLLDCLERCDPPYVANSQRELGVPKKPLENLRLDDFIQLAHKLGKISGPSKHLSHFLREYRNMIHPARQRREANVHPEGAALAVAVVRSLARELSPLPEDQQRP